MIKLLQPLSYLLILLTMFTSSLYAADSLNSITGPTTITAGETVTLTVDYEASEERTIAVYMQSLNPKKMQFYKRIAVQAGNELEVISFTVPEDIPTAGTFRYKAYIAPKGGKYSSNLGVVSQEEVKSVSNVNPPLTREELDALLEAWVIDPSQANADKIINANTFQITDMSGLFVLTPSTYDEFMTIQSFNLDISRWDVSNVTNMSAMFETTIAFNVDISNWDVSNVTDMSNMFKRSVSFNQDISAWNISNVINRVGFSEESSLIMIYNPFYHLGEALTREELFDLIKTWAKDSNQENADAIINANTSEITDMSCLFSINYGAFHMENCNAYPYEEFHGTELRNFNLDISAWDVSNVTNMNGMFFMYIENNRGINFNQDISAWDVSNVTNMEGMFYYANNFNQDLSGWNVSSVTSSDYFSFTSTLESQHTPNFK